MIAQYSIRALPKPQVQILAITNHSVGFEPRSLTFMIASKLPINPNFAKTGQKNEVFRRKKYKRFHIIEIHSVHVLEKPIISIFIKKVDFNFLVPQSEFLDIPESSIKSLGKSFESCSEIPKVNSCSVSDIEFYVNSLIGNEKSLEPKKEPANELSSGANNISIVYTEVFNSEQIFKQNIQDCLGQKTIHSQIKPKKIINYPGDIKITISSLEDNQYIIPPEKPEEKLKSFLEISINNPLSIPNSAIKVHSKSLPKLKPQIKTESKIGNFIKISESLKRTQKSLKLLPRDPTKSTSSKFSSNVRENPKGPYTKSFSVSTKQINNPYNIQWDKKVLKKNLSIKLEKPQISLPKINFCKSTKP